MALKKRTLNRKFKTSSLVSVHWPSAIPQIVFLLLEDTYQVGKDAKRKDWW